MRKRMSKALERIASELMETQDGTWRPLALGGSHRALELDLIVTGTAESRTRHGCSADLRERQRDLAYEMYGEALMVMEAEDADERRRARGATA